MAFGGEGFGECGIYGWGGCWFRAEVGGRGFEGCGEVVVEVFEDGDVFEVGGESGFD